MAGAFYPNINPLLSTNNRITVGSSAPSSPSANDIWYDTASSIYPDPWTWDSGLSAWRSALQFLDIDTFTSNSIASINAIPYKPIIPLGASYRIITLYNNIYSTLTGGTFSLDFFVRRHNGGTPTDTSISSNSYGAVGDYTTYSYTINQTFSVGSNTSHLIYITIGISGSPTGSYWSSPRLSYYHLR